MTDIREMMSLKQIAEQMRKQPHSEIALRAVDSLVMKRADKQWIPLSKLSRIHTPTLGKEFRSQGLTVFERRYDAAKMMGTFPKMWFRMER